MAKRKAPVKPKVVSSMKSFADQIAPGQPSQIDRRPKKKKKVQLTDFVRG